MIRLKDYIELKTKIDTSGVEQGVGKIKSTLSGLKSETSRVKDIFNFTGEHDGFASLIHGLKNLHNNLAGTRLRVSQFASEVRAKLGKPFNIVAKSTPFVKATTLAKSTLASLVKFGSVVGKGLSILFHPAVKGAKAFFGVISKVARGLSRVAVYRSFRMILNWIAKAFKEGVTNAYNWAKATGDTLADAIDQLRVESNYLKNTFGALASPLIQQVTPVITAIIERIVALANTINQVMSSLFGKSTWTKALKVPVAAGNQVAKTGNAATKSLKEWKKQLMGFDEINNLTDNSPTGSGGGGGGGSASSGSYAFTTEDIEPDKEALAKKLKEAWAKGDFTQIGKMVANKVNKALASINWSKIRKTTRKIATSIATFINGFVGKMNWKLLGKTVSEAIATAMDFVSTFLETVNWQDIGRAIVQFFVGIDWGKLFKGATRLLGNIAGAIAGVIAGALSEIGSNIKKYFADSIDKAGGNIALGLLNGILKGLGSIGEWIVDNIFKPFIDGIKSAFGINSETEGADETKPLGKSVMSGLFKGITEKWETLKTWFANLPGEIKKKIKKIPKLAISIGAKIKDKAKDLWNGFKKAWGKAKDKALEIGAKIKDKASDLWDKFKTAWANLKDKTVGILASIVSKVTSVWNKFKDAWNKAKGDGEGNSGFIVGFFLKILSLPSKLWQDFKDSWGRDKELTAGLTISTEGGTAFSNWANEEWKPKTKDRHLGAKTKITTSGSGAWNTWNTDEWKPKTKDKTVGTKTKITSKASTVFNNWKKNLSGKTLKLHVTNTFQKMADSINSILKGMGFAKNMLPTFSLRAKGGYVDRGEMFIARESGAEMVGRIGSNTAVANNEQIVEAIKRGVYEALVSAPNNSDVNVYLQGDTKQLFKVVRDEGRRYSAETGQYAWG